MKSILIIVSIILLAFLVGYNWFADTEYWDYKFENLTV